MKTQPGLFEKAADLLQEQRVECFVGGQDRTGAHGQLLAAKSLDRPPASAISSLPAMKSQGSRWASQKKS